MNQSICVYVSHSFLLCVIFSIILMSIRVKSSPANFSTKDQREVLADETINTLEGCITSEPYLNLSSFAFEPRSVPYNDSACLTFRMFEDMEYLQQFNIPIHTFSRFILKAQKTYNKIPYHNWHHGFAVLHFTYIVLKNCHLMKENHLTALEGLALMTAAMCHDIGHKGLDNYFHKTTNSSLARIYGSSGSIMESYHINVTLTILQNPEHEFIVNLDEKDSRWFKKLIEHAILATDLVRFRKMMDEEQTMATGGFDRHNQTHRGLLMSLLMSCGDLSDQTKSWVSARLVTKGLLMEFFSEGDKLKQLGLVPLPFMDRDKIDIPFSQVTFMSGTVIPTHRILRELYNKTSTSFHRLEKNLMNWKTSIPYFKQLEKEGKQKLDILSDSSLDSDGFD